MTDKVIFMVERNKKIADHLELDEIKSVMKEYKDSYDMYRKLLVISMVYQGETISKASDYVHTSRKTGERWVKNYNENGLEGLYSNYHNCGRKAKLTNEQLAELREIITSGEESYSIDDVQRIIKDTFGVNHDYKTVWTIVRKKLDLNYGKPFIKYSTRPEDAEEHLKKLRKHRSAT
ncbi:MAG: transposase [Methanobrevibacter millerae]|uniref:Transposase n=2 Tax=Methanobrevibacter millerae TaxID=230361 RepID=A0A8T3VM68_9EURY|nr:transposase [Methanobrevibacter millerae]